jgi:hypothetical protein
LKSQSTSKREFGYLLASFMLLANPAENRIYGPNWLKNGTNWFEKFSELVPSTSEEKLHFRYDLTKWQESIKE